MRWCSAARMSRLSAKHSQSVFQITPLLNACQIPPACPPNPKCLSNILAHMMSPGLGGFSAPVRSFPAKPTNRKRPPLESHHTMSQSCHCVPHWHHALTSADLIDPYWSFTGLTASPDFPGPAWAAEAMWGCRRRGTFAQRPEPPSSVSTRVPMSRAWKRTWKRLEIAGSIPKK